MRCGWERSQTISAFLAGLTVGYGILGSTKNFEFSGVDSIPIILEIRGLKPLWFTLSKYFIRHISYVYGRILDIMMRTEGCHTHNASVRGRNFFHEGCISWSYWNHGCDAWIHRKREVNRTVLVMKLIVYNSGMKISCNAPRKMTVVRCLL